MPDPRKERQRGIEQRYEDRMYDAADRFERRPVWTAFKWLLGLVAVIAVITIVGGIAGWWFSWGGEVKRITGPENSRDQTTAVLADEKGMVEQAGNVCEIDRNGPQEANPNDPQIVGGSPRFQYAASYRKVKADYDRRMANFFEAAVTKKLPIPDALGGLPRTAPTLEARLRGLCPGAHQ